MQIISIKCVFELMTVFLISIPNLFMYFHWSATTGHQFLPLFKKKRKKSHSLALHYLCKWLCGWILCWGGRKVRGESEARMFHFTPSGFIYETSARHEPWPSPVRHITMMMQTNAQIWRKQRAPQSAWAASYPPNFLRPGYCVGLEVGPAEALADLYEMTNKR